MSAESIRMWLSIAAMPGIIGVVVLLNVVLCREWVKTHLRDRGMQPRQVRLRPLAFLQCAFKVVYCDLRGEIHRATCRTDWHRRNVTWETDEVIDYSDETVA